MQTAEGIRKRYAFWSALLVLACLRACFWDVLWSDEDYHLAAAIDILHGKMPYRDFWYDKPPLAALFYLPIAGLPGTLLRLWDAAYILLCCLLGFRLSRSFWGEAEGLWTALLIAFFTTFYLPSAVIPFAPDALLIAPHLAAIYFAQRSRPLAAGLLCGLGFWINVKALFVLAACAVWGVSSLLGFGGIVLIGATMLATFSAFLGYWEQVWIWGFAYAPGSPVGHPIAIAAERIGHWLGFHLALVLSWLKGIWQQSRIERFKLIAWLAFSFAAVCFGNHFAPRYFLQLLPPLAVVGGRGIVLSLQQRERFTIAALCLLLLIPFARFAPRYALVAMHAPWSDTALNSDSQQVAARINALKQPGDTLFVWGYRPDMYVYTRLSPSSLIWDSQPLTGVAADRHLSAQSPITSEKTTAHLEAVEASRPTFFVDGLGLLNPKLKPQAFPEMRSLLTHYHEAARTRLSAIYQRND